MVHCPKTVVKWKDWPMGPKLRPNALERKDYLLKVLRDPCNFKKFAAITGYFDTAPR